MVRQQKGISIPKCPSSEVEAAALLPNSCLWHSQTQAVLVCSGWSVQSPAPNGISFSVTSSSAVPCSPQGCSQSSDQNSTWFIPWVPGGERRSKAKLWGAPRAAVPVREGLGFVCAQWDLGDADKNPCCEHVNTPLSQPVPVQCSEALSWHGQQQEILLNKEKTA